MEKRYLAANNLPPILPPGAVGQVHAAASRAAERLGVEPPVDRLSTKALRKLVRRLHTGLGILPEPLPDLSALQRAQLVALIAKLRAPGKRGRA